MTYPLYPRRKSADLAGFWDFLFIPKTMIRLNTLDGIPSLAYHEKQAVPGCFDAAGTHKGERGVGIYRRSVCVSKAGTVRLDIGALLLAGRIFWDGVEVGRDVYPYSAASFEWQTDCGRHELVIAVENVIDTETNPLFCANYDFYAFGGILRSITLTEMPDAPIHLGRCTVTTLDLKSGRVRLDAELVNAPDGALIALMIQFDEGESITWNVTTRNGVGSTEFTLKNKSVWSPASPNLHTVRVLLPDCSDEIVERFGLRTIEAKNGRLLLNGEDLFLAGYNRHESHPQSGAEIPRAAMLEDLQILRSLHCNFIRGCHYPQSQEFLDLCDETGFLVWEESLAWGNGPEMLNNGLFRTRQVEQTANMVRVSRNHPCVILWGFLNEVHSHLPEARTLIEQLVGTIKTFDTSRPVTFASMMIAYGEQCLDLVDVISCNTYPGWYGTDLYEEDQPARIAPRFDEVIREISKDGLAQKPLLISEIGAAALYGCRDTQHIPWTENFQADYIAEVCKQITARPRIRGLALWHFADARTFTGGSSLNRARGFNNKGTLDEFRREKLAASVVRTAFSQLPFNNQHKENGK